MHVFGEKDKSISVIIPASGVVTALEPVLRACNGTWIANGSGSADREVVDYVRSAPRPTRSPELHAAPGMAQRRRRQRLLRRFFERGSLAAVPYRAHAPDLPARRLAAVPKNQPPLRRRCFAGNGGRGIADSFRAGLSLSRCFREWSRKHGPTRAWRFFGTFRGRIRKPLASARGNASLSMGCWAPTSLASRSNRTANNFLETVDRAVEALTEWDRFAVNRQGHVTRVRPYPISVAFPENSHGVDQSPSPGAERAALCAEMSIEASLLGVGVDRVDYTKGILERFRGLERFFELNPAYQQRFTFVQIGAAQPHGHRPLQEFPGRSQRRSRTRQLTLSNVAMETARFSQETPFARRDRALFPRRFFLHGPRLCMTE